MGRYRGHHIPDEYDPDWNKYAGKHSPGEYWEWWHLGYEDGVWQTKWDYGIPTSGNLIVDPEKDREALREQLSKANEENSRLRELLAANVRVIKAELLEEIKEQIRGEDIQTTETSESKTEV